MFVAIGYRGVPFPASIPVYLIIAFTTVAMGVGNAAVALEKINRRANEMSLNQGMDSGTAMIQ